MPLLAAARVNCTCGRVMRLAASTPLGDEAESLSG